MTEKRITTDALQKLIKESNLDNEEKELLSDFIIDHNIDLVDDFEDEFKEEEHDATKEDLESVEGQNSIFKWLCDTALIWKDIIKKYC